MTEICIKGSNDFIDLDRRKKLRQILLAMSLVLMPLKSNKK
jgi:hypothetical protein